MGRGLVAYLFMKSVECTLGTVEADVEVYSGR